MSDLQPDLDVSLHGSFAGEDVQGHGGASRTAVT